MKYIRKIAKVWLASGAIMFAFACGGESSSSQPAECSDEYCQSQGNQTYQNCLSSGQASDQQCLEAGQQAYGQCNAQCAGGGGAAGGTGGGAGGTGGGTAGTGGGAGGTGGGAGGTGGGAGGTGGGTGGTGGGAGGAGGMGGAVDTLMDCNGLDIQALNNFPGATANSFELTGQRGVQDNFGGSCSTPDKTSPDSVVSFTAPSAGQWIISTKGSDYDTVLYARATCDDADSELACNDDSGGLQSTITLDLAANQAVYVYVDTYDEAEPMARPFTLSAQQATPPVLNSAVYVVDNGGEQPTIGMVLEGNDPSSDAVGFSISILGADGMSLFGDPQTFEFANVDHDANGNFVGTAKVRFNAEEGIPAFSAIVVAAIDELSSSSMEINAVEGQVQQTALGAACNDITTVCSQPNVCYEDVCTSPEQAALCPADWAVEPINLNAMGATTVNGDFTNSMGGYRNAGCASSGAATEVYSFSAPANGTYIVSLDAVDDNPDDEIKPDTVLFARTLCNIDSEPDLACNDDRSMGDPDGMQMMERDLLSRIEFQATAGQTIYLFADVYGADPQWRGAYTMTITRQ